MKAKSNLLTDLLHTAALGTLAVAWPLFDLLARNAEFFVVRRSQPIDILLLVVAVVALPALLLIGLQAALLNRRQRPLAQAAVMGLLSAALVLPVLKRTGVASAPLLLSAALIIGGGFGAAYLKLAAARWFVTALSPAVLACPGLFLFDARIARIAWAASDTAAVHTQDSCATPVVFLVFDELPLLSLLDGDRRIDGERYPHFAALARDAIWFRDATTVHNMTTHAVPALLTGRYPQWPQLPIRADYPENLFTWLGGTHRLKVLEPVTRLCPAADADELEPTKPLVGRLRGLWSDLSVVYLHLLLPEAWSGRLPPITHGWKDFRAGSCCGSMVVREERPRQFERFLNAIAPSDRPAVYFMHLELPHWPFNFLPSGKHYGINLDLDGIVPPGHQWGTEHGRIEQTYQRHLLQVGYADSLLGRVIERLKQAGLYERSIVVATADHGISFRPADSNRHLSKTNLPDITRVPLLIKKPHQRKGLVSDRAVQTIDVLPTLADILSAPLPWPVDGRSAIDPRQPEWSERICFSRETAWKLGKDFDGDFGGLERKLALFGAGPIDGLYQNGPHPELVGAEVGGLNVAGEAGVSLDVDKARFLANVDLQSGFVPAQLKGTVYLASRETEPLHLAVAFNGVIRTVTRTFEHGSEMGKWSVMLPESAFQQGKNILEVFVVRTEGDKLTLWRATLPDLGEDYRLNDAEQVLVRADGGRVPIVSRAWQGHLDYVHRQGECLELGGWSANVGSGELPELVLVFADERLVHTARPNGERSDLVAVHGREALRRAGYRFSLPVQLLKQIGDPRVRLFALGRGQAAELRYPASYKKRGCRPLQ